MADLSLTRIERAMKLMAQHVVLNETTLPVFIRLEQEYEKALNIESNPLARAKQLAAQGVSAS